MVMRVEFYKDDAGRTCGWIAAPPKRRPFQGTTMAAGRDLPHDLVQFTIERALGISDGFWGLLAHGASFASVTGRRPTRAGRALARAHEGALAAVEGVVNGHYQAWKRGEPTPVRPALDTMYARWLAIAPGERLVLEWPVRLCCPARGVEGPATSLRKRYIADMQGARPFPPPGSGVA